MTTFGSKTVTLYIPAQKSYSDASDTGWGCHSDGICANGKWTSDEQTFHINYLELLAIFFALKSLCADVNNTHIRIFTDNATAMAYINHMGGMKSKVCDLLAKNIWSWCQDRTIWLSAAHIAGKSNVLAARVGSCIMIEQNGCYKKTYL